MAINLVIKADELEELINFLASSKLNGLPPDSTVCLAVCSDLQEILDLLFNDPDSLLDEDSEVDPDVWIGLSDVLDSMDFHGLIVTDIRILDSHGSILIRGLPSCQL